MQGWPDIFQFVEFAWIFFERESLITDAPGEPAQPLNDRLQYLNRPVDLLLGVVVAQAEAQGTLHDFRPQSHGVQDMRRLQGTG